MPVLETMMKTPARQPRERRHGGLVLLIVLILLVSLVGAAGGWWAWATSASGPQDKIVVVIPHGATGAEVANILKQDHVVRSSVTRLIMLPPERNGGIRSSS